MKRKIAIAAIVGGVVHALGLLRGRESQAQVPSSPSEPVSPRLEGAVSPTEDAALTREMAEDLQRQINALAKRLAAVEQTQSTTVGFTRSGTDLSLVAAGKVAINGTALSLEGATINVTAAANLIQKGGMILLN